MCEPNPPYDVQIGDPVRLKAEHGIVSGICHYRNEHVITVQAGHDHLITMTIEDFADVAIPPF